MLGNRDVGDAVADPRVRIIVEAIPDKETAADLAMVSLLDYCQTSLVIVSDGREVYVTFGVSSESPEEEVRLRREFRQAAWFTFRRWLLEQEVKDGNAVEPEAVS